MFFVGLPDTTVGLSDRFSATVIRGGTVDLVDHLNGYEEGFVTPAEQRILQALADHGSTKDVARDCHVEPHTVDKHVENLGRKLGVHSRAQLVAEGFRLGLIR